MCFRELGTGIDLPLLEKNVNKGKKRNGSGYDWAFEAHFRIYIPHSLPLYDKRKGYYILLNCPWVVQKYLKLPPLSPDYNEHNLY